MFHFRAYFAWKDLERDKNFKILKLLSTYNISEHWNLGLPAITAAPNQQIALCTLGPSKILKHLLRIHMKSIYKIFHWNDNLKIELLWLEVIVVLPEEVVNFRGFRVSDFDPYTKIENSENSETVSRLVVVLLEEVGNFRVFRVFDFGPYTKTENSENLEIVSRLVKLIVFFVCLRKLESSEILEFSILTLMLKPKTRKTFQNVFKACKVKWICSV